MKVTIALLRICIKPNPAKPKNNKILSLGHSWARLALFSSMFYWLNFGSNQHVQITISTYFKKRLKVRQIKLF
jgi:hypothetical protein